MSGRRSSGNKSVSAADAAPISVAEAKALFDGLAHAAALVLAVSGGPDSTALLVLAARWRGARKHGPDLLAVTIDHGLRPESAREARAVKRLAAGLGVRHRTLRWSGRKPRTGLQQAAREMRYRLLAAAARKAGASCILTAHTLDDQAETVLLRLSRGSGLTGLGAMTWHTPLDVSGLHARARTGPGFLLVRPLLDVPKARLVATLERMGFSFVSDPSNRDPRFTRARLRGLMPALAEEGLDGHRLALLAARIRRANAAIEVAVDAAAEAVSLGIGTDRAPIAFDAEKFFRLPAELALRLLGRAVAQTGHEGQAQLGKLEALSRQLGMAFAAPSSVRFRRTLAGSLLTLAGGVLSFEPAPPRAGSGKRRRKTLTTRSHGRRDQVKAR